MNTELLLQVKEAITQHPRKFNMRDWKCKTAMCLGGWACKLTNTKLPKFGEFEVSMDVLDLTPGQANKLFFVSDWPTKFRNAYYDAKSYPEAATVAADRIDHFIKRKV